MQTINRWALCLALAAPAAMAAPQPDGHGPGNPTASPPATADLPLPVPHPLTVLHDSAGQPLNLGTLEVIQAETVLFEAQLARARALGELQKKGYDTLAGSPFNPAQPAGNDAPAVKGAAADAAPPQVVEIAGSGTALSALLVLSNGNQVHVQTGSRVPGTDYVVKRISISEVVVSSSSHALLSLTFAG